MPVTRSQTRGGQPSPRVTSPRHGWNRPRRLAASRQGNAVVVGSAEEGSPSTSDPSANGNQQTGQTSSHRKRCRTCPSLVKNSTFVSNVTKKTYTSINHSSEAIACDSQNLIYLLSCTNCNVQYVGETTIKLSNRMNIHRTAKTGCKHMINHFKEACPGASFSIQVIELFEGNGYVGKKVCPSALKARVDREDYWMKELRTIHPYGLNERARGQDKNLPVGKLFPRVARTSPRSGHSRNNRNNHEIVTSHENFFHLFDNILLNDKTNAFYRLRVILNRLKKSTLKKVAFNILSRSPLVKLNAFSEQYYLYVLDIIETLIYVPFESKKKSKLRPKHICNIFFHNKAIEIIHLPSILKEPAIFSLLPSKIQTEENRPVVTFQLGNTIRNKILNYKETVESIFIDDEVSFSLNSEPCDCCNSPFSDKFHKHVITGDLRIVENEKLRKLLVKGPNYREPRKIDFDKASEEILRGLNDCITNIVEKSGIKKTSLNAWKEAIMARIKDVIELWKPKTKIYNTRSVLKDQEVQKYLESFHRKYVIVTIDKASKNFAIICKKFYVAKLIAEVSGNNTYQTSNIDLDNILRANEDMCKKFGLTLTDKQKTLPIMYWTPKMHKNPIGFRFIVASKSCSTKPLTAVMSNVFKVLYHHVESFHRKSRFFSGFSKFWVVQNSSPVIEHLNRINAKKKAKRISTFDFATLYTTLPHDLLVKTLTEIINFVFDCGCRNRLGFSASSVYWTTKGKDNRFFTNTSLAECMEFLIRNCYFKVGNHILKQNIGIPMGIDPAPFWANLFLYQYESQYVQNLVSNSSPRAYNFHSVGRFIDDLCAINDRDDFFSCYNEIYPKELQLKVENHGTHATFLDLDISIENNIFRYKLFDKRDAFPFFIVRMPHKDSNIPSIIFYSSIYSEILRISRCTLLLEDVIPRISELFKRMLNQGAEKSFLNKQIVKCFKRFPDTFMKFGKSLREFICLI